MAFTRDVKLPSVKNCCISDRVTSVNIMRLENECLPKCLWLLHMSAHLKNLFKLSSKVAPKNEFWAGDEILASADDRWL